MIYLFFILQESKLLKFLGFMWNPLSWVMEAAAIMAIAVLSSGIPDTSVLIHGLESRGRLKQEAFTALGAADAVEHRFHRRARRQAVHTRSRRMAAFPGTDQRSVDHQRDAKPSVRWRCPSHSGPAAG